MGNSRYRGGLQAIVLMLAYAMLSACDSEQHAPAPIPERAAIPAQKAPRVPRQEAPPAVGNIPITEPAPEEPELDLGLPTLALSTENNTGYRLAKDQNRLPDLFDAPEKQERIRINAELLSAEHNPDIVHALDGVKVSIERKLGD